MKALKYILPIFCLILFACKNAPERPEPVLSDARKAVQESLVNPTAGAPGAATPEPAQNAEGVWHYTCPSGCAGGGSAAGPCGTCGATLAHNSAYHNTTVSPSPASVTAPGIQTTTSGAAAGGTPLQVPPPTAKPPEPAQNASGVWHYTCPSGCAGGGGSATACGGCGATLAHNTAYHN